MKDIKKILIADDHSIVSRGLYYVITLHFTGVYIKEIHSLQALSASLSSETYTHLILDLNLEDGNSLDLLPEIKKKYPQLQVLIYSMVSEEVFGQKILQYDTSGFLSKKSPEHEVVEALDIFLNGGVFISKKLKKVITAGNANSNSSNTFRALSITELKVLGMIFKGNRSKEIANELQVTLQTIATYKTRIFKKLGTDNIFEIQKMAELHNVSFS